MNINVFDRQYRIRDPADKPGLTNLTNLTNELMYLLFNNTRALRVDLDTAPDYSIFNLIPNENREPSAAGFTYGEIYFDFSVFEITVPSWHFPEQ